MDTLLVPTALVVLALCERIPSIRRGPQRLLRAHFASDLALGVPGEVETYPQGWLPQLLEPLRRKEAGDARVLG